MFQQVRASIQSSFLYCCYQNLFIKTYFCIFANFMEEQLENKKDDRVYFGVLRRVGLQGSYQTNLMRIFYLISAISGATFNVVSFLFYQQAFNCSNFQGNCNQKVCSLPSELRTQYLPSQPMMNSLANYYGDTHCERMEDLNNLKQFFLIGASVGVFVGVLFIEMLGRKRTIQAALVITNLSIILVAVFEPYLVKGVGLFLWGGCSQIAYSIISAYITETNAEKNRISCYAWLQFWYVCGCLLNVVFFYALRDWTLVLLIYYLTAYVIAAVTFIYYVQSTPLELISTETPQNAFNAFIRIADRNQITDHGLTLQQIESLQSQYKEMKKKKHDYVFNVLDILRYPSIRSDFLKLGFLFFMIFFLTHGVSFVMDQLRMNIFMLSLLNVCSQIVVIPLFKYLLLQFPRKKTLIISLSVSAVCSLIAFGLAPNDCFSCKTGWVFAFLLIAYFITRLFGHLSSNIIQASLAESFPAQIRSIAIYGVIGLGRVSNVVLPFLAKIKEKLNMPLMLQFSIFGGIAVIGAAIMRETYNILPQEIIKELQANQKQNDQ